MSRNVDPNDRMGNDGIVEGWLASRDAEAICDRCGFYAKYVFSMIMNKDDPVEEAAMPVEQVAKEMAESLRENGWSIQDDSVHDYCPSCLAAMIGG